MSQSYFRTAASEITADKVTSNVKLIAEAAFFGTVTALAFGALGGIAGILTCPKEIHDLICDSAVTWSDVAPTFKSHSELGAAAGSLAAAICGERLVDKDYASIGEVLLGSSIMLAGALGSIGLWWDAVGPAPVSNANINRVPVRGVADATLGQKKLAQAASKAGLVYN